MLKKSLSILGFTVCAMAFSLHLNYANKKYGIADNNKASLALELVYTDTTKPVKHEAIEEKCALTMVGNNVTKWGVRTNCYDTQKDKTCKTDYKCHGKEDVE